MRKKLYAILCLSAAILFCGCTSIEEEAPEVSSVYTYIEPMEKLYVPETTTTVSMVDETTTAETTAVTTTVTTETTTETTVTTTEMTTTTTEPTTTTPETTTTEETPHQVSLISDIISFSFFQF